MLGQGVKRPAAAVLLLALSQATPALAQQQPLDCSGSKPSDNTVYNSGQHSYTIQCALDYGGNDIAAGTAQTFEECITLCDTTPGCIDVSYGKPGCWMKNKIGEASVRDNIWTARRNDLPAPVSCDEPGVDGTTYTAPGGVQFKILCGKDYAGADMGMVHSDTFAGCMDACSTTAGCVDVSYVGGPCYLKNALNAVNNAGHVWSGVRVDALSPGSGTTTTGGSSTTSTAAAGGATSSPAALSCIDNASDGLLHTTPAGVKYDIICGQEYAGGDLRGVGVATFEACLAACDAEAECIDVSYSGGACYMKKTLNGPLVHAGHVWTAVKHTTTGGTGPDPEIPELACVDGKANHEIFTTSKDRQYQVFCGVDFVGGDLAIQYARSFTACIQACEDTRGCVSVGYTGTTCYLKNRLRPRVARGHVWSALYLGPAPPPPVESTTTGSSTTTPAPAESTSTSSQAAGPTQGDSDPIPTSNVYIPEFDDSWTSTYTYTEVELPTWGPTPAPTPEFEPVEKTCFIDPGSDREFHLISPDVGYVIEKETAPGFLSQPETEEEGLAMMETIADWKPPAFVFEKPAGAVEGLYDIVYNSASGKRYFSMAANGALGFATASGATTAVFGVNCDGYLTVTAGGATKSLKANGEGTTTELTGDGNKSEDAIRVLPKDLVPANPNSLETATSSDTTSKLRRRAWDGMAQDGYAPRCPNTPRTVWPRVRAGARNYNPNGCGSGNGFDYVPDWNFGGCCNEHDNCFDDCATKTFERCNLEFWGCMTSACVRDLNRWYNSWLQPACIGMGTFYFGVVSSYKGKEAFEGATRERCECYCREEPNKALCGNDCLNVFSNPSHCGGCNRVCPPGTHCEGLGCACDTHRCGNTCLNLANHPRNCGSCGNVCASGMCYQGKCFDPPANPDRCYPREGFENGDFQRRNGDMWSVQKSNGVSVNLGVFDGAAEDSFGMVADVPKDGSASFTISQDVHVCTGQNYELSFKARRVYGDGNCGITATLGDRQLQYYENLPETRTQWRTYTFRLSPDQVTSGSWEGPRFYRKTTFRVGITCAGQRSGVSTIRMDAFSIAPV